MTTGKVEVVGLRDLQRELRAINKEWPKELRVAAKASAEIVAGRTRSSFASRPGSAPKVAATVRALGQQRGAAVRIGAGRSIGSLVALGNEFGGGKFGKGRPTPRGGHTTQFPPFKKSGYSLYPSIASSRDEMAERYADAVDRIVRRAFPS